MRSPFLASILGAVGCLEHVEDEGCIASTLRDVVGPAVAAMLYVCRTNASAHVVASRALSRAPVASLRV